MPNYTENYNLKKPLPNENYNVQDQNDNMDTIDTELKKVNEKVDSIEVPVTSVNEKTGDVVLTADDVGAETPSGAQAKAEAAAAAAIAAHEDDPDPHEQYALDTELAALQNEVDEHKAENAPHREAVSIERKNPDDDGIFTLIEFKRADGTLFKTSQLNGTSPYTTRTVKFYDEEENLVQTIQYSITYSDDEVVSEVIISA